MLSDTAAKGTESALSIVDGVLVSRLFDVVFDTLNAVVSVPYHGTHYRLPSLLGPVSANKLTSQNVQ